MTHRRRSVATASLVLLLAACADPAASPAAESPAPATSESARESDAPSPTEQPTVEPVPSEALEPFSCDLPVHVDATDHTNIADVRVGTHADYDRVVFEYTTGVPEVAVERATPPFAGDASGLPLDVRGDSFLRVTMRGGTKQMPDGSSSYEGPTDFDPGFETLVDVIEGGDFEAQSTWYLGLSTEACVRVFTLTEDGAPRLVIDVEH